MTNRPDIEELLYRALCEPIGLLLESAEPAKARQLIYGVRTKLGDPDLGRLQVRLVEIDGGTKLAVVKSAMLPQAQFVPLAPALGPTEMDL